MQDKLEPCENNIPMSHLHDQILPSESRIVELDVPYEYFAGAEEHYEFITLEHYHWWWKECVEYPI